MLYTKVQISPYKTTSLFFNEDFFKSLNTANIESQSYVVSFHFQCLRCQCFKTCSSVINLLLILKQRLKSAVCF